MEQTYEPYLTELIGIIRNCCPVAKFYLHRTWAYDFNSDWEGFTNYGCDQERMFKAICRATEHITIKHHLKIIPTGNYIQEVRKNDMFDTKKGISLYRDGGHLSYLAGRYLAELVWFRHLLQGNLSFVKYLPEELSGNILDVLKGYFVK